MDFNDLVARRDKELRIWQTGRRLAGPCESTFHMPSGTFRLYGVRITLQDRAGSRCITEPRQDLWCATCRPWYKYWFWYVRAAQAVLNETGGGQLRSITYRDL